MASPRYRRSPTATWRELGGSVFLADPRRGSLLRANETVRALWTLLADPVTKEEAISVFQAAFPSEPPTHVASWVEAMFDDLESDGLIEPVP
jgi:hypothetical protein